MPVDGHLDGLGGGAYRASPSGWNAPKTPQVAPQSLRDTALDLYAAGKVFCLHLLSFESLLSACTSAAATAAYFFSGSPGFSANMSWTIVTFAVVSPMIMQIRQAFTRREQALEAVAEAKALVVNVMLAHALWDWGDNGRQRLPLGHVQKTKTLLLAALHSTAELLLMPTLTRGRHRLTSPGRKAALEHSDETQQLQLRLVALCRRLHQQVEVMKRAGLPANEASRVNQYHWLLHARVEKLLNIKFYRTPQATRSVTRLFIILLPAFFGPYYVYIARGNGGSASTSFGFALALSIMTSLLMSAIFNVERLLEDPFRGGGMDGIHVHEVVAMTERMLDVAYNGSEPLDTTIEPPWQ